MTTQEAERIASEKPAAAHILTLAEALDLTPTYAPQTLVCLRGPNQRLLEEAARALRGRQGERHRGALRRGGARPLRAARHRALARTRASVLEEAVAWLNARGGTAVPIWRLAQDAGEAIADVAIALEANAILVGTSQRGTLWRLLRGNVIARLIARVPRETRLVIVG